MITLKVQHATLSKVKAELVVHFILQDRRIYGRQIRGLTSSVKDIQSSLSVAVFSGKEQETLLLYPNTMSAKRQLLVGLGNSEGLTFERLRHCSASAAKLARDQKVKSLALMVPDEEVADKLVSQAKGELWENIALALAEGAILSLYRFDKYISKEKRVDIESILLLGNDARTIKSLHRGLKLAQTLCEGVYSARNLENAPGNEIFPETLASYTVKTGRKHGFRTSILNAARIKQLRMGGLLGVSQGSSKPPRFIIMEHNAHKRSIPTIVLVGKGVTFDAGGISIKPAANMAEMKMDMSGAAAVIGTMEVAARLKIPLHIVGLVPATENLLGGSALKPGDILRHYNGKTSEIDNTDAEGRLILADALSFAAKYNPDVVIDLATLTGACVVALGHIATGMMGNNQQTMDRLKESGERTYERVWQLPMFDEYERLIKSDIADVKNVGGRWAGAITAAMFLRKFIGDYKWVHLDIAGTAIMEESSDYIPKGGSGVGVRLLIDFLQHWKTR